MRTLNHEDSTLARGRRPRHVVSVATDCPLFSSVARRSLSPGNASHLADARSPHRSVASRLPLRSVARVAESHDIAKHAAIVMGPHTVPDNLGDRTWCR